MHKQAVVRGEEGGSTQTVAAWEEMHGVIHLGSLLQPDNSTPMGTGSAVLLPWCCCLTTNVAFA